MPLPPEQSKWSRLYDTLFGRKALDEAGKIGPPPPSAPPQPQTDISGVAQAARDAAIRMQKAKDENKGVTPKEFGRGGVVYGKYGR